MLDRIINRWLLGRRTRMELCEEVGNWRDKWREASYQLMGVVQRKDELASELKKLQQKEHRWEIGNKALQHERDSLEEENEALRQERDHWKRACEKAYSRGILKGYGSAEKRNRCKTCGRFMPTECRECRTAEMNENIRSVMKQMQGEYYAE